MHDHTTHPASALGRILLVLLAMLCAGPLTARAEDALTSALQQRYETLESFTADFTQTLVNAASKEEEVRTGTLSFRQPSLIRWETVSPERELLLVGEKAVWDYFADEEVAYRYKVEDVLGSKTMLRFISGQARLDEDFIIDPKGDEDGLMRLDLYPREPEPSLVQASLWIDADRALIKTIHLIDFYGNVNHLAFDKIELDPELADTLFAFTPPEGVEVLEGGLGQLKQ